ncbi:hypothetical protein B0J11DRAFT_250590 [Dendryphion nanum]|uniref:AMP-activated protein kinase glycogen-binding domain-containing protein n=1 Tax=Dendryphion nanum TaxID=256645 RepID=A0A9P9E437_9PLEO|nr:hypothetical protein B0J11DRAFT_250590 [Dendryphion nanum]
MGNYTFTWAHPASEVFVTGDFDNWQKTIQLSKSDDGVFKKTVELPKGKHAYKFVVDGTWLTNDSHPGENDASGNYNNVLNADEIEEPVSTLSSAAPESTTAALAGQVPKEKSKSEESIPGAFPLTPPAATPGSEPQAFSINPIPATSGLGNPVQLAPGDKVPEPSTLTSNTIDSTVKHDKEPEKEEEETVSVAPIPATAGAGNPIHLAPGDKVPDPSTLTSNTISSTVKTDEDSYAKADALPPQLDPVVLTPEVERAANGGLFHLPPLTGGLIPESSLPKDLAAVDTEKDTGVTIQSAAPTSTTAALAGEVPKEPRDVPATVTESQEKAGFAPEASANPEAVAEKKEVEEELKEKVPEEPAATETPTALQTAGATAAAGVTAAAGAFAAATYAAKDQAAKTIGVYSQGPADNATPAAGVPEVVAESQKEAHVDPEASANPEAVLEKKAVEAELLQETTSTSTPVASSAVPEVVAESQKAAHVSPEASANAEAVEEKKAVEAELLKTTSSTNEATSAVSAVPEVVAESQKEAHASPEAAANAEAVEEKKEVEAELLKEVTKTNEAGEPAPAITAATTETAPAPVSSEKAAEKAPVSEAAPVSSTKGPEERGALNAPATAPAQTETAKAPSTDSRDVSPMSKQPTTTSQAQPTVTTGVESSKAAAKTTPETPSKATTSSVKGTPESVASGATDKKKKRTSIFGKIKAKLSSKH